MYGASVKPDLLCFFLTDLHGRDRRYELLEDQIMTKMPRVVLLGGDLLPGFSWLGSRGTFIERVMIPMFQRIKRKTGTGYPHVLCIPGNDDPAVEALGLGRGEEEGLWTCLNQRSFAYQGFSFYGYSFVPPTPFQLKDWEKYDVSRYVDPGCIPPTEGQRTVIPAYDPASGTIREDLETWLKNEDMSRAVLLFHSPPYKTNLDRAGLDGVMVEHVPLDVHVGSMAIGDMIMQRQPYLTLHGHVHESTRITGEWKQKLGSTVAIQGAGDCSGLALVTFYLDRPWEAERVEIQ